MANLVAADVTFTAYSPTSQPLAPRRRTTGGPNPRILDFGVIAFGAGASTTYPAGGIPISTIKLGMPSFVEDIWFPDATDAASGFLWQWDQVNQKIRGYTALGTEIATNATVNATTLDAVITGF